MADRKQEQRAGFRADDPRGGPLTTDQGVPVDHTDNSLRVGERGPTLLEDFHFREKITHFDHERIPERVVHARGAGAYGYFQPYESLRGVHPSAAFLQRPSASTPVFVRFSTVPGPRGSADTVRDVRGFATKFYTSEGNFDLVGNNMPVFFIQDGIKFPDFVHAVKPEPHNEIPQASSAHDTLWDFVSAPARDDAHDDVADVGPGAPAQLPDDAGLRRAHVPARQRRRGKGTFVKFHWKPRLGAHSLVWDEAQKVRGQGPGLQPPRPVGGDRGRPVPGVGAGRAARARGGRGRVRLRPARRHQAHPGGAGPGAAGRPHGPGPQPGQLLRRDRAGGVPHWATSCRASTSPTTRCCRPGNVLLPGHPAHPARRAQLRRSSRSTGRSRRCATTSGTATTRTAIHRAHAATTRTPSAAAARPSPTRTRTLSHYPERVDGRQDP